MTASAHPAARPEGDGHAATLPDVLDRILDKGLVIAGDVTLQLLDVEVLTIKVRLLLASAERAEEMGIDWWKNDPFLSSQARQNEQQHRLQQRVDKLEHLLAATSSGSDRQASDTGSGNDRERDESAPDDSRSSSTDT